MDRGHHAVHRLDGTMRSDGRRGGRRANRVDGLCGYLTNPLEVQRLYFD